MPGIAWLPGSPITRTWAAGQRLPFQRPCGRVRPLVRVGFLEQAREGAAAELVWIAIWQQAVVREQSAPRRSADHVGGAGPGWPSLDRVCAPEVVPRTAAAAPGASAP